MRKLILVLLLLLALPLAAAAAPDSLALPDFANRLEGAAAAVEQNRPGDVGQLLADQVTVAAPSGPIVVDMRWATAQPAGSSLSAQQRTRVAEQLRAMAREARQVERTGQAGLDARLRVAAGDRQRLDQILQPAPPPEPPAWVRRLLDALLWGNRQWQRLADWWGRQFAWVP
ncbi:MAG: hypothetical protein JWN15_4414, partial [Firmicutes bacterium]|nr:hypothetical protein [Bacillota bacterium]